MITVCIMSYKYGHLAAHAVDSVLSQSRRPNKVLFVDDGIGDCSHITQLYPEVEVIEREQNLGTVANFQNTLEQVTTDKVLFLGADNWLRQDALELLDEVEADIVTYDILITGTEGWNWKGRVNITGEKDGYPYWSVMQHHGSMLMNTEKAKQAGYSTNVSRRTETMEDKHIFDKMKRNKATHIHLPEALLYYRRHRENFNPVV